MEQTNCPSCGKARNPSIFICECGYDFNYKEEQSSTPEIKEKKKRNPATVIFIILHIVAALFGLIWLIITIPAHLIYNAIIKK